MSEVPDPIEQAAEAVETVHVLKRDFDLLQQVANFAVEDTEALARVLCMYPPAGMSPREFFQTRLLPRVAQLMHTQEQVNIASEQIRERAARFGNKTKDFAGGVKGLKVGEKIPGLFGPGS